MNKSNLQRFVDKGSQNTSKTKNKDHNDFLINNNQKKVVTKNIDIKGPPSQVTNIARPEEKPIDFEPSASSINKKSVISDWKDYERSQINIQETNLSFKDSFNVGLDCKVTLSREEIVAQRKLKVAARKQIKKLEKQQVKEKLVFVQSLKPEFSLELAAEEFPTLNAKKTKKKIVVNLSNQESFTSAIEETTNEGNIPIKDAKSTKLIEKSWKPKVKDPICINLSQALQNTTEKNKPLVKKTEPPIPRNVLSGNMLDSDNPTRKKGKVRPDKIEKPSKLKMNILKERNERRKSLLGSKESSFALSEGLPSKIEENNCRDMLDGGLEETKITVFTKCELLSTQENKTINENKQHTQENEICVPCIHSRRFREYCTNCLTEEIVTSVCGLLEKVAFFQDRSYARQPIKASAKRRYVAGINQTTKYLQVRKVKLLVIAPDLERNPSEGGLDDRVGFFKKEADCQNIPCVFGPNRKRLGKAVKKNTLVSCVAVLSYDGAEEQYCKVMEALQEATEKYKKLTGYCQEDCTENIQVTNFKEEDSYASASDVTSSLLATLREDLAPSDRMLRAIEH